MKLFVTLLFTLLSINGYTEELKVFSTDDFERRC